MLLKIYDRAHRADFLLKLLTSQNHEAQWKMKHRLN